MSVVYRALAMPDVNDFQPWSPCVVDITEDLDNVKENLAGPMNDFLRK
ncbi:MAG: hypothetical protein JXO72_00615 [Vicinamibacteria bacterium]|nr:hypothetical protein [Vicinamibacteria bacterium]